MLLHCSDSCYVNSWSRYSCLNGYLSVCIFCNSEGTQKTAGILMVALYKRNMWRKNYRGGSDDCFLLFNITIAIGDGDAS